MRFEFRKSCDLLMQHRFKDKIKNNMKLYSIHFYSCEVKRESEVTGAYPAFHLWNDLGEGDLNIGIICVQILKPRSSMQLQSMIAVTSTVILSHENRYCFQLAEEYMNSTSSTWSICVYNTFHLSKYLQSSCRPRQKQLRNPLF